MSRSAIANIIHVLAAAVADDATFTVAYTSGTDADTFAAATNGEVAIGENDVWLEGDSGFTFTYGAPNITVTNKTGATLAAQTELLISLGDKTVSGSYNLPPNSIETRLALLEARVTVLENP